MTLPGPIPLLSLALIFAWGGGTVLDLYPSLPDRVLEWTAEDEDAVYDRDTLFDYMNGGAEVYLAFDFRNVFVRRYRNPSGEEITLDIYDMGTPAEAFGIFSCDREDDSAGIGQDSEFGFGLLRFWKGRHFVSILAGAEGEAVDRAVLELGRATAGILGPEGPRPALLRMLPSDGLREDRVSFFHGNILLNNRFFIASDNILRLDRRTDCVFAEYGVDETDTVKLLIVRYPDVSAAEAADRSFRTAYMPDSTGKDQIRTENGRWTLARRRGRWVAVVFDAPDPGAAEELYAGIDFRIPD